MIWKAVGLVWLRSVGTVGLAVALLVAMAIGVERGPEGLETVRETYGQQMPIIWVWVSPLIGALGLSLGWTQMESRGEIGALQASGIGAQQMVPVAVALGVGIGLCASALSEFWVPHAVHARVPQWVWTEVGPQRVRDGLTVFLAEGGRIEHLPVLADSYTGLQPMLVATSSLDPGAGGQQATEWFARLARVPACVGFAVLALAAGERGRPLLLVASVGGVLLILQAIAWTMGSYGQLAPWLAGSAPAWAWLAPWAILRAQSVR